MTSTTATGHGHGHDVVMSYPICSGALGSLDLLLSCSAITLAAPTY